MVVVSFRILDSYLGRCQLYFGCWTIILDGGGIFLDIGRCHMTLRIVDLQPVFWTVAGIFLDLGPFISDVVNYNLDLGPSSWAVAVFFWILDGATCHGILAWYP
ncbi:unnamed protein product, partial [Laminaria digitata]